MPRLFTGIEIPTEISHALARLTAPLPGAKWLDKANYHITLKFAGDIDNPTAREFADQLARIDVPCFSVRLKGLGVFGASDPHSLWAGVEGGDALDALARASERAGRLAGLKPETRAFTPHVTLARFKGTRVEAVARYLERNARFATEEFTVERFVLYSSRPSVGGGPYVAEDIFPLAGSHPGYDLDDWRETL